MTWMNYVKIGAIVLVVIGLVGSWMEKKQSSKHRRTKNRDSQPPKTGSLKNEWRIDITQSGHYGDATYMEGGTEAVFGWEFGGNVLVVIDVPSELEWSNLMPFPMNRRRQIAERVATELIRQKAPGSKFRWAGNLVQIIE